MLVNWKPYKTLHGFRKTSDLASHGFSTPSAEHRLSPAVVRVLSDISGELARFGQGEINLSHWTMGSHIDTGALLIVSRRNVKDDLGLNGVVGQGAWDPGSDRNDVAVAVVLAVSDENVG